MSFLIYNDSALRLDDRTLAHLQYVIVQKYRRGESFLLSWTHDGTAGGRERSLWLSPNSPLSFEFDSPDDVPLDLAYVGALLRAADSTGGVWIVDVDGRPLVVEVVRRG